MKNPRFLLEWELRKCELKVQEFHTLVGYKAELEESESLLEKVIGAKSRVESDYNLLRPQMPSLETRILELKDELHTC